MAHYIFNLVGGDAPRERAAEYLRAGRWNVDADEPHRGALAAGDLVLLYLGALIGRAELASAVESDGVLLAHVEEWDPPVPMSAVLSQIDRSQNARADFETGVVRITATEYETALAVAAARQ
jgi:hypothetical protein